MIVYLADLCALEVRTVLVKSMNLRRVTYNSGVSAARKTKHKAYFDTEADAINFISTALEKAVNDAEKLVAFRQKKLTQFKAKSWKMV